MTKMGRPVSENAKRKVLTVRVSSETYEKIKKYAEANKKTMTQVALQVLEDFLSRQQ